MKKVINVFMCCLIVLNFSGTNLFAETEQEKGYEPTLYVSENYDVESDSIVQPRTRGNCTDVYSKEWCDSHGYENNRPVPGTALIPLISDELKCYLSAISSGAAIFLTSKVSIKEGVYVAVADVLFQLYICQL
ncbi:hypothetical protein [Anaerorhabdus sp.]|uniref:hypothetical protein n=1 Tax=Anaerorhabdus sp. TaxID=1872524 RepID=UPI002FCAACA8